MRVVLAFTILVATAAAAAAKTPLPERADHAVFDAANVIDDAHERQIEAVNTELFQRAHVAVVVITVPRLVDETISDLAVRVQHDWGVGERGKDESVVIALSVEDRKIFIATGYGSEGYLPDGKVGEIRDRATPALRANDFASGLLTADLGVAQIAAAAHNVTLTGLPASPASRRADDGGLVPLVFLGIMVVVVIIGGLRGRGGRGGGGGFGSFALGALLGNLFGNRGGGFGGGGFGGGGNDGGGGGFGGFGGGSGGGGGAGGDF